MSAVTESGFSPVKQLPSKRSLRPAYLEWVEEQIEAYKESIPRSELLCLADRVVEELRVNRQGQYQLTEILLLEAVDRHIFRLLKLPDFKSWCASGRSVRRQEPVEEPRLMEQVVSV